MKLDDVIEALEMTSDTSKAFYDLVTKRHDAISDDE